MVNNGSTVKISVVIPVFNGEKYISHLIDSLKAQTFTDLEFIFVDDLGEDNSMSFVHEWASKTESPVDRKNFFCPHITEGPLGTASLRSCFHSELMR